LSRQSNGWVKIYPGILEEDLTPSQFKFFVGAIILANPPSTNQAGTVDLTVRQLSTRLKMSTAEVWRREKDLAGKGMITLQKGGFSINKYQFYQGKVPKSVSRAKQIMVQNDNTSCFAGETKKTETVSRAKQNNNIGCFAGETKNFAGETETPQSVSPAVHFVSSHVPESGDKKKKYITKKKKYSKNVSQKVINEIIIIPSFIDKETWDAFIEMRKKMKAVPTNRAIALIFKELEKLKKDGNPPDQVLQQSIMNNWKGVFPLKGAKGERAGQNGGAGGHTKAKSSADFSRNYESPDALFGEGYTDRVTNPGRTN